MSAWSEARIASHVSRVVLGRRCILLVDRCNWTGHEADVLGVTMDGRLIDVEIKISRADLRADIKKNKWWHRGWNASTRAYEPATPRLWPPKVWKHYYVMPAEIWRPELLEGLPAASGVLVISEDRHGWVQSRCVRRAKPCRDAYRLQPEQMLDVARLANLRMWDARLDAERRQPQRREYLWDVA